MRAGLIAPIPDLGRYIDMYSTYHLALYHLLRDGRYTAFYRSRSLQGDFVSLDNGAKEFGQGAPINDTLQAGYAIHADEVVLPDVIKRKNATVRATGAAFKWLSTMEGKSVYKGAGQPRLMIVPQGRGRSEWRDCLYDLITASTVPLEKLTVGVAYHYHDLFEGGIHPLMGVLRGTIDLGVQVHLLGWIRSMHDLPLLRDNFSWIRSVDSSRPFVYAKGGIDCRFAGPDEYPGRDSRYFTESIPDDQLVYRNIRYFQSLAGDYDATDRTLS